MGTTGAFIVYICIWWIVFFSVLPIGIKSQNIEFKDNFKGNDPGAPKNPRILKKFFPQYPNPTIQMFKVLILNNLFFYNLNKYFHRLFVLLLLSISGKFNVFLTSYKHK